MASKDNKKKHPMQHLIAGGCAGLAESSVCHPLDTIKTRMQLRRQTTSAEKVVVRMRNSMMDPVSRLQHSLREPAVLKTAAGAFQEPGLHLGQHAKDATVTMRSSAHMHPRTVQATLGPIGTARRIVEREGFGALYKVEYFILCIFGFVGAFFS
jgi:hypothetical protein